MYVNKGQIYEIFIKVILTLRSEALATIVAATLSRSPNSNLSRLVPRGRPSRRKRSSQ